MDTQRLLVWAAFGLLAFMTYQAWLQDYAPVQPAEVATDSAEAPLTAGDTTADSLPGLPATDADTGTPS